MGLSSGAAVFVPRPGAAEVANAMIQALLFTLWGPYEPMHPE
jgi:hypothetical protein